MVSVVILTKNEEENIKRCLNSVSWCDEIVIIDDYSKDETFKKALSSKLKVQSHSLKLKAYKRHLNGDFAAQRNFGLSKAKGEWVLFIDADEVVTQDLRNEIKAKTPQGMLTPPRRGAQLRGKQNFNGFYIKRKDYFLGRWLRYGETARVRFIRLGKKGRGEWKGKVHEIWQIDGKIGYLSNPLFHYPHKNISKFLAKISTYTDFVAQCWREKGRKMGFWEIITYPLGKFIQNYIFRLGFLDGIPGLVMVFMMSFHSFLARGKYWLNQK